VLKKELLKTPSNFRSKRSLSCENALGKSITKIFLQEAASLFLIRGSGA